MPKHKVRHAILKNGKAPEVRALLRTALDMLLYKLKKVKLRSNKFTDCLCLAY